MLQAIVLVACWLALAAAASARPVIVAAESVYGDLATQIAGADAAVASILSRPDQDPHLFEASPAVARALADATVVVANGAGYDPWMDQLLRAGPAGRVVIVAADLVHSRPGDNPHLWYDTATMRALATALEAALAAQDPAHAAAYAGRRRVFVTALDTLEAKIAALRARVAGQPVTATEPVFGLMAAALGLTMRNERFQRAIMNDTEPRVSDTAAFEDDLVQHRVRALLYNSQATGPAAQRLLGVARRAGVPVVPVTETEPAGVTYQAWMADELDALDHALAGRP